MLLQIHHSTVQEFQIIHEILLLLNDGFHVTFLAALARFLNE